MRNLIILSMLLVLTAGLASSAVVTYYSDQTLFNAGLSSYTLVTFDATYNPSPPASYVLNDPSGVVFTSINSGDSWGGMILGSGGMFGWSTGKVLKMAHEPGAYLQITLPEAVTAIGFSAKFMVYNNGWGYQVGSVTTVLDGSSQSAVDTSKTGTIWIGYTSDTPFTTVLLYAPGGAGMIDNLTFGNVIVNSGGGGNGGDPPADAVEVTTFLMIGTGLAAMKFGHVRLRRAFQGGGPMQAA